ncbi:hypothetical protein A6A27_40395 [Micromonospora sp. CB01531]|nr:hypothetical protein A6A27_40395 [Micromonospora sp. CB01531]
MRLSPEMRSVLLGGQQAAVLAVLIERAGMPCRREEVLAAMPPDFRPPTVGQISAIISNIRRKLGVHRIATGAGGWWLDAPIAVGPLSGPGTISYRQFYLDLHRRRVWLTGMRSAIQLGWQEYMVLRVLIEAYGMPRSRDQIWLAMPARIRPARAAHVGVIVHRLRQRLGRELIITGGGGWRVAGGQTPDQVVGAAGAVRLDATTRRVCLPDRAPIDLSPQEAATLQVLIDARGVPLKGAQVLASTPVATRPKSASAVSTVVSRLRKKLGPERIETSRQGWFLVAQIRRPTTASAAL